MVFNTVGLRADELRHGNLRQLPMTANSRVCPLDSAIKRLVSLRLTFSATASRWLFSGQGRSVRAILPNSGRLSVFGLLDLCTRAANIGRRWRVLCPSTSSCYCVLIGACRQRSYRKLRPGISAGRCAALLLAGVKRSTAVDLTSIQSSQRSEWYFRICAACARDNL